MKVYSQFGLLNIILCFLILGCAAVEWQYKHPLLKSDDSYALINEEDIQANDIISNIKGFCDKQSKCPDQLYIPVMKDYSNKETIFKALYTVSPYGLMTLPFADFTGHTIAVPPEQLGIIVHRKYFKVLKKEEVLSVERGNGKITYSWFCLKKDIHAIKSKKYDTEQLILNSEMETENNKSKYITFQSQNLSKLLMLDNVKGLYKVTFETYEWDDEIWTNFEAGKEYTFKLSRNKIIAPGGVVISGQELGPARIPDGTKLIIDYKIVDDKDITVGKEFEVDENCMFALKGFDGKIWIESVIKNSEPADLQ